jgi:hypothetical protein
MREKKPKLPKILESKVRDNIRTELKRHGIFHYKEWQGMGSAKGVSDIIGVLPDGRFLAIEIKTPEGMRRRERERIRKTDNPKEKIYQDIFIDNINRNNGVAFYATSSLDVFQELRRLGYVK